jgi:hypothetical protein
MYLKQVFGKRTDSYVLEIQFGDKIAGKLEITCQF